MNKHTREHAILVLEKSGPKEMKPLTKFFMADCAVLMNKIAGSVMNHDLKKEWEQEAKDEAEMFIDAVTNGVITGPIRKTIYCSDMLDTDSFTPSEKLVIIEDLGLLPFISQNTLGAIGITQVSLHIYDAQGRGVIL